MMNGCGCEYCASLHGVATVRVPEASGAARAEVVSMQTYRDWLDRRAPRN
jgi:hypothetical protein